MPDSATSVNGTSETVCRTFKYRLWTDENQERELEKSLDTHRHVYNDALAMRKETWQKEQRSVTFQEQYQHFAALRNAQLDAEKRGEPGPHWLAHIPAVSMRDTLKRLDKAFQGFFHRVKSSEKPGHPRFRGRDHYDSIPFDNYNSIYLLDPRGKICPGNMSDDANLSGYRLRMFGVGIMRVNLHRPINGKIKTVTVKREAGKWYVCFCCELPKGNLPHSTNPPVGIDVGLESFLTTSDGANEPNPRYLKESLPELRRKQRSLSRKKKGGSNRKKARKKVAKLHARVKNQRREHHYRVATRLVLAYGLIAVESLNIRGMLGNGRLSRAITDAGWYGFVNVLKHQAAKAGVSVVEVNCRGTSQECSQCGKEVRKELSDRWHECPHCGCSLHRDVNAARNILARGLLDRAGPAGANVGHEVKRCPRSRRRKAKV
jgi:putative transposase